MADTAAELQQLQSARKQTVLEIDSLAVKKKEMELLVKKASLALFLKEQYANQEKQILDELAKSDTLGKSLHSASETAAKIAALNEEIEVDPNVTQLREIIARASRREPTFSEALEDLPAFARAIFIATRSINRSLLEASRIILK